MTNQRLSSRALPCLLLVSCVSACSADLVDLGGGEMVPSVERGARCLDSPIVTADAVYVTNQAELETLRGCEELRGELIIEIFAGADTSPLGSLRSVGGSLVIGAIPELRPGSEYDYPDDTSRAYVSEIIEQGYLPSLHGLGAIESVAHLALNGVGVRDLSDFESLRSVSNYFGGSITGMVQIYDAPNLTSLAGLENVRDVMQLVLNGNPALESLDGLVVGSSMGGVSIDGSPRLSSLRELAPVVSAVGLGLFETGVRNLDELENLGQVVDINLSGNLDLENIDRLGALSGMESLTIAGNPRLTSIPTLSNLFGFLTTVVIEGNAELRTIALGLTAGATAYITRGRPTESSAGFFEIRNNPKLETLALAAGLEKADYLTVDANASLASIDFGSLRSLDRLALEDNPALTTLVLGDLQTIDSLWVTDNPLLTSAQLGNVLSFERVLRGNADDGEPAAAGADTLP
jgi:hypothetical protein